VRTQNLNDPSRRDRRPRSTPSAQPAEIAWTDQTDPVHQEEQSPSEVLTIGAIRRRPSFARPPLPRVRMAGLGLLAAAGAVLCIKAWPPSAPTALTADTQPPRPPETIAACAAYTCTQMPGAPTALAQTLRAALPNQQTYIALTTLDSHTGRVHRIQIDTTLPGHISLRMLIDRPTQQITTPTPWSFTADGDSPWPSHANRQLIATNGCTIDTDLQGPPNPAAHQELPTALAEHIAEAAARASTAIAWQ